VFEERDDDDLSPDTILNALLKMLDTDSFLNTKGKS
jgi:hypothetical protein